MTQVRHYTVPINNGKVTGVVSKALADSNSFVNSDIRGHYEMSISFEAMPEIKAVKFKLIGQNREFD